jgi:hypothetical protein
VKNTRGHQCGRGTAEAVEHGHHLRHVGHLDEPRHDGADDGPHDDSGGDQIEGDDLSVHKGRHHGDQHADGRDSVSRPGGLRRAQPLETEDEEYYRAHVENAYEQVEIVQSLSAGDLLNI